MAVYSIKDLEQLSGIKAHTIRIWEQRYNIVEPKRTHTNIRYYEEKDLRRLLNIAVLNRNGYKISKIAKMAEPEMVQKVASISAVNFESASQLDALTLAAIEMNEYKFSRIVEANTLQMGFERTMMEVVFPFLEKLDLLWLTNSLRVGQERFVSYLIRQKILVAIDKIKLQAKYDKKYLLFLSEGNGQELSILFAHFLIKKRGGQVVYLGKDIDLLDLKETQELYQADYIYTFIGETASTQNPNPYLKQLAKLFPNKEVLIAGYESNDLPENITFLNSLEETMLFLEGNNVSN